MTSCRAAALVLAASQAGGSHESSGAPCQDAYAWAECGDRLLVVAVADGLGTAPLAEEGAGVAVEAAVNAALAASEAGTSDDLEEVARASVAAARSAVECQAEEDQVPISALASTLLFVAASGDKVCAAQIGDGAVVVEARDGLDLLSAPGRGEYLNEVTPLTADGWRESLRVSPVAEDVRALAVFTDGCERAALGHGPLPPAGGGSATRGSARGLLPHQGFFGPLFDFGRGASAGVRQEEELRQLLAGAKMAASSDDDKTLVLVVLRGREPASGRDPA